MTGEYTPRSDGFPNDEDIPATYAANRVVGDIYAQGADHPAQRLVDTVVGAGLFTTNSDPSVVGVDPITGEDAPTGTDVGFGAAVTAFLERGIWNGDFSIPPPYPELPISDENPLPYWTVETVSGGEENIQFYWVADATRPSGGYIHVVCDGTASCNRRLVQIIRVASSGSGRFAHSFGCTVVGESATGPTDIFARLSADYLQNDATTVVGGLGFSSIQLSVLDDTTVTLEEPSYSDAAQSVPDDAAYALVAVGATMSSSPSAAGTFRILDVSHLRGAWEVLVTDITDSTKNPGRIYQNDGSMSLVPDGGGTDSNVTIAAESLRLTNTSPTPTLSGSSYSAIWSDVASRLYHADGGGGTTYLLSGQLVPLDFVLLNVPANTTTQLQPSDNALGIGTPRLRIPWGGSIVGMSYRLTTSLSGGTMNIQATVGGSNVWQAFALTTSSSQHDATSQAVETDTFTSSDALGVQVVTSAAFAPTTMDMHVILWVCIDYTGS